MIARAIVTQAATLGLCLAAATGCVVGEGKDFSPTTFEEFRDTVYQEPDTGVFIVDGDMMIPDEAGLRAFWDAMHEPAVNKYLTVDSNRYGGAANIWDDNTKLDLSFCISNGFGANKGAVVSAMRTATSDWESAANIRFRHASGQDGNCTASNGAVVFDVNPTSGQPYLARAFFPDYDRASRNILIDSSAFTAEWPLAGILRHELGHVLGFRHEHTRFEAGFACWEDASWTAVTEYDSASVMHYPQCNGTNDDGQFRLTALDRAGAASLYGAP